MIFLAIGLVSWVNIARLVRGQIMSLKSRDFVNAAKAMGGMGRYIAPFHRTAGSLGAGLKCLIIASLRVSEWHRMRRGAPDYLLSVKAGQAIALAVGRNAAFEGKNW